MPYKRQENKKLAFNSEIQTYQILTNDDDDEICIPSLSSILLAVPKKEFYPMVYVWVITNGGEVLGGKDWYWQIHKWQRWSKTCLQFGSLMSLSLHGYSLSQGDYKGAPDNSQNSYFGYKWVFWAGQAAGWTSRFSNQYFLKRSTFDKAKKLKKNNPFFFTNTKGQLIPKLTDL